MAIGPWGKGRATKGGKLAFFTWGGAAHKKGPFVRKKKKKRGDFAPERKSYSRKKNPALFLKRVAEGGIFGFLTHC